MQDLTVSGTISSNYTILTVDDDIDVLDVMESLLESDHRKILTAGSGARALEILNKGIPIDLVITDIRMKDIDGIELLKEIKKKSGDIEVIIMTAYTSLPNAISAVNLGAERYIRKPFEIKDMEAAVKQVEDKIRLKRKNKELLESLKNAKKELEKKNIELEKLDELKDEFLSMVSHEVRTPLTIIKEFVAIMLDRISGDINKDQEEHLTIVNNNIDRLAYIIDDVLDISKLESGRVKLAKEATDMSVLIKDAVNSFNAGADAKEISLNYSLPSQLSKVLLDKGRISQVLTNIVGNALKFTPENGKITVEAHEKEGFLEISVTDTGKGITRDDFDNIFNKFVQVNRTPGSGSKGTGLGLPIAKKLVELHGGEIWVESPVTPDGTGSRFIFTLPGCDEDGKIE